MPSPSSPTSMTTEPPTARVCTVTVPAPWISEFSRSVDRIWENAPGVAMAISRRSPETTIPRRIDW